MVNACPLAYNIYFIFYGKRLSFSMKYIIYDRKIFNFSIIYYIFYGKQDSSRFR